MTSIFNAVTWIAILGIMCSFVLPVQAEDSVMTYSDGEIVRIMAEANEAEIKAGKEAPKRAESSEVKDFAKMMVKEHSKNLKQGKKLAKSQKIKPEMSGMLAKLKAKKAAMMTNLKARKGSDFDKAYIKSQVEMHQDLLNDLDQKFIPAAKNEKLKSFLQETRGHVSMHLDKAKAIQAKIGE